MGGILSGKEYNPASARIMRGDGEPAQMAAPAKGEVDRRDAMRVFRRRKPVVGKVLFPKGNPEQKTILEP
jgi:hypothetical protein